MKILVSHLYFWPDTAPYGSLLRVIAEFFVNQGHEVTVYTSQPSYKPELSIDRRVKEEQLGSLKILRSKSYLKPNRSTRFKITNCLTFLLGLSAHLLKKRGEYDIVMCSSMPPVLTGFLVSQFCRIIGSRFVYHIMDIYPEVLETNQPKHPLLCRLARKIDQATCNSADPVIVLSNDMAETLRKRRPETALEIEIINNFNLPTFEPIEVSSNSAVFPYRKQTGKFRILYAGNIGRYQKLDRLIEIAKHLKDDDQIEFVFMGEGSDKSRLQELVKSSRITNVQFIPFQDDAGFEYYHRETDLGLISINLRLHQFSYPSKTASLLHYGCPLLVLASNDSELSKMVNQHSIGYACEPDEIAGACEFIKNLSESPKDLSDLRERATLYGKDHFSKAAIMPLWEKLLQDRFAQ